MVVHPPSLGPPRDLAPHGSSCHRHPRDSARHTGVGPRGQSPRIHLAAITATLGYGALRIPSRNFLLLFCDLDWAVRRLGDARLDHLRNRAGFSNAAVLVGFDAVRMGL